MVLIVCFVLGGLAYGIHDLNAAIPNWIYYIIMIAIFINMVSCSLIIAMNK
jgi:hypothetical protein